MITKRLVQWTGVVLGGLGVVVAATPDTGVGRRARRLGHRLARDLRYAAASVPGMTYRLSGARPDPDVSDAVLADRVRSSLGPLEKRLDVPRVHVMVEDHHVLLHGDVGDEHAAHRIERAVARISGVEGVESHLHAGMTAGDTRPSEGARSAPPSEVMARLLDAARAAGAMNGRRAVHAVLCGFMERIPEGEREQMLGQLPADVRALAGPPRRSGSKPPRLRTVPQLVAAITAEGGIETSRAEEITRAVLGVLHDAVHGEADDVAAVLPHDLRDLWEARVAG